MASTTVTWKSLVCAPTACDQPLPHQGDSAEDPAVAFVDIPGDEACAPSTCIQVGVPACPASAHLPGAAQGPGLLWGSLQPHSLSRWCFWGMRGHAGWAIGCADLLSTLPPPAGQEDRCPVLRSPAALQPPVW